MSIIRLLNAQLFDSWNTCCRPIASAFNGCCLWQLFCANTEFLNAYYPISLDCNCLIVNRCPYRVSLCLTHHPHLVFLTNHKVIRAQRLYFISIKYLRKKKLTKFSPTLHGFFDDFRFLAKDLVFWPTRIAEIILDRQLATNGACDAAALCMGSVHFSPIDTTKIPISGEAMVSGLDSSALVIVCQSD